MMRLDGAHDVAVLMACAVLTRGSAAGASPHGDSPSTIREQRAPHSVRRRATTPSEKVHLTVTGPGDLVITREFAPGLSVELDIQGLQYGKHT